MITCFIYKVQFKIEEIIYSLNYILHITDYILFIIMCDTADQGLQLLQEFGFSPDWGFIESEPLEELGEYTYRGARSHIIKNIDITFLIL